MSPSEIVLTRIMNMGDKEFVSKDVCFPEYGLSITALRSTFKRFVVREAVEITRKETVKGHDIYYYKVNKHNLRFYLDSKRKYCNKVYTTHSYGWEKVWPEFFVEPDLKGKKRTITHADV